MRALIRALLVTAVIAITTAAQAADAPTEANVTDLISRWAAAQNAGDSASYEKLYATTFEGVRRSGKKATTFDRAGWLADRAKMFKKPMQVEAGKPAITIAEGKATAKLTQTWGSGTYRDTGNKELVIVLEGGEPRIAREEMLDSKTLPRVVVRWTLTPMPENNFDVTLEVLGSLKGTFTHGSFTNCRPPASGILASGKESEVGCREGDYGTYFGARHEGTKLVITETESSADDGSAKEQIHQTWKLPAGADVLVEVVEGTPDVP